MIIFITGLCSASIIHRYIFRTLLFLYNINLHIAKHQLYSILTSCVKHIQFLLQLIGLSCVDDLSPVVYFIMKYDAAAVAGL